MTNSEQYNNKRNFTKEVAGAGAHMVFSAGREGDRI